MSEQWYVEQAGQVEGPVPSAVVMARRFAGFLQPDTLLSRDGYIFKTFKELESEGAFGEQVQGVSRQEPPTGISVVCPHCGHENRAPRSAEGKRGRCPKCQEWLIVHEGVAEPVDTPVDLAELRRQAQAYVQQQLKTPASAKFPAQDTDWSLKKLIDGRYQVSSFVDAQNLYGAMLRYQFACSMRKDANNSGRWLLEAIELKDWITPLPASPPSSAEPETASHIPNLLNSKQSAIQIVVAALLTVAVISYMSGLYKLTGWNLNTPRRVSDDSGMARVMAERLVQQQLKSPSTAQFSGDDSDWSVVSLGGGAYRVSSYVDAQNSFGAMIRSDFTAVIRNDPRNPDEWILDACNIVGR